MAAEATEVRLAMAWNAEGIDSKALRRRTRTGELVRVRYGAYATVLDADARLRHRQLIAATVPRLGASAVLSHSSAAVLHDLPIWEDDLRCLHITRARTSGGRRSRHLHVHTGPLEAADVVTVDGIRITTLARTVADLARSAPLDRAVAVADAGLRLGMTRGMLGEQLQLSGRRHGVGQLLFIARFADSRAESVGESRSRLLIHRLGLPAPTPQYRVVDPATGVIVGRCDFGWEEHRTIGEFDGLVKYGRLVRPGQQPGDVVFAEKHREDLIRDLGYEVVRWISDDLARPTLLRGRILRAFAGSSILSGAPD